jgi:site-specific recombinase XerD
MVVPNKPRLLDQVSEKIRFKHYSSRTKKAYVHWIRRFIIFHGKQHPRDLRAREIEEFLTCLAVKQKVASTTQNQAFNALLFLYKQVLDIELPRLENIARAKRPQRLPVVLTVAEVRAILA